MEFPVSEAFASHMAGERGAAERTAHLAIPVGRAVNAGNHFFRRAGNNLFNGLDQVVERFEFVGAHV